MIKIRTLFFFLLTLLFSSFFLFYNLGLEQLFFGDEAIHLSVIKEMFISGNWSHPTFRGHSYFSKPPLKMWVTLVFCHLFEPSLFWLRFPDALFSLLSAVLIFILGIKLFSSALTGFLAVVFLMSCPVYLFRHCARMGVQDSSLFLCTCVLMLVFWIFYQKTKNAKEVSFSKEVVFIAIFTAMGLMVKYVAGFYGFICGFTFLFITTPINKILKKWWKPITLIFSISIIPLMLWLFYSQKDYFSELYEVYAVEIFQRVLGEGIHNTGDRGFYFRELVIRGLLLSKTLMIPLLVFWFFKLCKKDVSYLYLFIWGVCPVVGFSLINSKLIWYAIPSFPAITLAASYFVVSLLKYLFSHNLRCSKHLCHFWCLCFKILLIAYLFGVFNFQGKKLVEVTKRLLKTPKSYQIEGIVNDIKVNDVKVSFYDRDDSSIFVKTSLPDYDRFFLLDILPQITFKKAPEHLALEDNSDILIFPACHLKRYQEGNENNFKSCAYFNSTLRTGSRFHLPESGYVAVCLNNCGNLEAFSSCDSLPRKIMKQDCAELDLAYKKAKKKYTPQNYAKKPSFFAPLRDY